MHVKRETKREKDDEKVDDGARNDLREETALFFRFQIMFVILFYGPSLHCCTGARRKRWKLNATITKQDVRVQS